MRKNAKDVVVLLSGGQDSTTALCWAKEKFAEVYPLTIHYGQRHFNETKAAIAVSGIIGTADICNLSMSPLEELRDSSLFEHADEPEVVSENANDRGDLPHTFVPVRNAFFLLAAAAYAYQRGARDIVIGVSEVDFSGYPDCRQEFIDSMEKTINLAFGTTDFRIHAPLINLSKKETVEMMLKYPKGWLALAYTHTCYENERPPCGHCAACKLRAKGFDEAGEEDPLELRTSIFAGDFF